MTITNKELIIKTIIYRMLAFILSLLVGYLITKNKGQALLLTIVLEIQQTIVYFLYEKAWLRYN